MDELDNITQEEVMVSIINHPDALRCLEYLQLREQGQVMTLEEVAVHFDVDKQTVWRWQRRWETSGLLARCRRMLMTPMIEDIRSARAVVMAQFNQVMFHQLEMAKGHGRSEFVSLQAAQWLYDIVVKPAEDDQEESGAEELSFVIQAGEAEEMFNPLMASGISLTEDDPE